MISDIKVYQLTPEQVANYVPGMNLGNPVRIDKPKSMVRIHEGPYANRPKPKSESQPDKPGLGSLRGRPQQNKLTKAMYLRMRVEGMNRVQIAERQGVAYSTLCGYVRKWGLSNRIHESMAMSKIKKGEAEE
ncbi:hypothetical protein SAMN05216312_12244 [Cohnella sp. OV330]|uniref:hypothetical protein n=1 Tax=Cohnella sp. OV330 TaxID=1855288 RepID=UPI0008ED19DF|nr:hypothetical protein [Cohnella sp. OV330]SFB62704.1 hypothetical protein SAMN05216312_12244 [Cohnella sp. OV330]